MANQKQAILYNKCIAHKRGWYYSQILQNNQYIAEQLLFFSKGKLHERDNYSQKKKKKKRNVMSLVSQNQQLLPPPSPPQHPACSELQWQLEHSFQRDASTPREYSVRQEPNVADIKILPNNNINIVKYYCSHTHKRVILSYLTLPNLNGFSPSPEI